MSFLNLTSRISKIINLQTFNSLHYRNFRFLFLSSVTSSVGMYMQMVAQGWLILELTDSPLSLGIVWATSQSPSFFLGILAGTVADKVDRRKLLVLSFLVRAISAVIMGVLVTMDIIQLWHILLIAFINGIVMVFSFPTQQTLAVDIVGSDDAMNAISINATGMRVIGVFGGAAAGFVIELLGLDWPFYIMAISLLVGILILFQIRDVERTFVPEEQSTWNSFIEGLRLIKLNQIVLVLMIITLICEILGFSYSVVLPVFARDVLEVGAIGLGMFNTAASIGGLIGGLTLASLGNYKYKGRLILGIFCLFGVFLILFSQSPWYLVSLFFLGMLGFTSSAMDAMGHTILQLNVSDEQRGRAMGLWMMSIGFGPIGSLTIGGIASLLGAPLAVTINGSLIIVTFIFLIILVPKLRSI
ncbi:MFS transporter [Chloroflexota bacterium]